MNRDKSNGTATALDIVGHVPVSQLAGSPRTYAHMRTRAAINLMFIIIILYLFYWDTGTDKINSGF